MISLLLFVFLLQLVIQVINTLGKQHINDLLWHIYTLLPTSQSEQATSPSTLRNEVTRLKKEMVGTSAQDDFAKWARLRRQHDKAKEKYDNEARARESFRGTFNQIITALRFLGTQGVNFIVNAFFTKEPMFWLPQGWVPYQVEWILSFPRAPLGSISVNVWGIACGAVIGMVIEGVVALWTLRTGTVVEGPRKGEKIKMDAVPTMGTGKEKKEL